VTALPLVGRAPLLAELEGCVAEARAGRGGLVLLTGEAGIGKTRLAEELVRRSPDLTSHWAWCRAEQSAGSLRTWSTVLRALAHGVASVSELATTSPTLHALLAGAPDAQAPHPEASRAVLATDVAEALRLAGDTPRLVVLDDLHDAGTSTLRLLVDLLTDLRGLRVLVVGTARDTGWEGREDLHAELLRQARRLALTPLDVDDVARLLGTDDPDRAQQLQARSGGNPLLVSELARSGEALPASLRALVAGRLAALPAGTRDVLAAAAVLGPRFRLDVLAEVTGVPLGALAPHLVPDLVTADVPGEAAFVHELLRDAVHAGLDPAALLRWHAQAGLVLQQLRARGRMVGAAEVAGHLLRAGPEHAEAAAQACLDAAELAAELQAFDDAVRWRTRALEVLDDPAGRAAVLVARARDRRATGDSEGARADLLLAGALAAQAGRPDVLAQAALGLGSGPGGFEVALDDQAQLDLLEDALTRLPADALALRATVLARLSVARTLVQTTQDREATAAEAVALARTSGDPVALGVALAAHCDAVAGPDHVQERLQQASEVVDLAVAARDGDLELLGRRLRLVALLEQGDRPAAEREARAYAGRAAQVRHPMYLWYPPLWEGMWALAEGRYDACRDALDEVARIGAGSENAEMLGTTQRWLLHEQTGEAAPFLERLEAYGGVWVVVARALVLSDDGDLDAARARLDTVGDLLDRLPFDSEWLATVAQAATVVDRLGDHPLRAPLYDALLPYAGLWVVEGIGAGLRGPVEAFLARVAPDPAVRDAHRLRAQEQIRALGAAGLAAPAPGPGQTAASLTAEGDVWAFSWHGRETRVRDSKGMRDLVALLARPGQEVPALDLYGGPVEHDTGEVLDAPAREAYKQRLAALEEQESLSPAEADERALLLEQLASAYGLGGRVRRTGSSAERARSAVTARLRETLRKVAELDPELGRHLARGVRTGTFCSYSPEQPVSWRLTP
jgi:hypothetical protein